MRQTIQAIFLVLLSSPSAMGAQTILQLSGNSWETGAFPNSDLGDEYQAIGILNDIDAPLIWNTAQYSYTWYMRGLISGGESMNGTTRIVTYAGGQFTVYVDSKPSNHDYGVNPPNATSPSTFTDGTSIYLDGVFGDLTLTFDVATSSGSFVGELTFTGGDVFPLLDHAGGWTFGANIAGLSPGGYDLGLNGQVYLQGPSAVESSSWGSIKSLYH